MENTTKDYEVKEKSMYLVHLDNTRIIILASIFIGIIAISFLIGMNLTTQKKGDYLAPAQTQSASLGEDLSTTTNEDIEALLNSTDGDSADNDIKEPEDPASINDEPVIAKEESIIPPKTTTKAPAPKKTVAKSTKSTPKKVVKKSTPKPAPAKEVVAASYTAPAPEPAVTKSGWSIQVASFNTITKAQIASAQVNDLNYNSFIDKAFVNGKTYYRVKVGPLAEKSQAIALLNQLQSNKAYEGSYLVKEK